jgi:DNA-binding transcriptional MerR regulator
MEMALTVSQVAKLSGVSVRALHHYDEIGLLSPGARTDAGYRLYDDDDLQRLQQVLFFRELGFPLEQIQRIVTDRDFDLQAALRMQRQLLTEKAARIHALIGAVDARLGAIERGTMLSKEEMFEVFGEFDPAEHEEEAQRRWGETDAYKESARRTKRYTKQDWLRIKEEGAANVEALARALDAGTPADDPSVMALAEQHRQHIDRWFYPCSREMHRGLGEMYVADPRFSEVYERVRPGLARYLRDAIVANAERE